jgi:dsDNA-binding SOS-regulon protein
LTQDAKQEAFEQAARYKLHVTLNDDEADYLEGLLEAKRKEELNVKKETREQLELFRRQQEEAERRALEEDNTEAPKEDQVQWAAPGRKRKKGPDSTLLRGIKLRKSSSAVARRKRVP